MEIKRHKINNSDIAEILSDKIIINTVEDGKDILGDIYYQGFDKLIIHKKDIIPDFFDLKNKMAGEILQKFSNYRVRLAIVGDFSDLTKKSINDFINESNKLKNCNFLDSVEKALEILSKD